MLNKTIISIGSDTNVLCEVLNARQIKLVFSLPTSILDIDDDIFEIKVGEGGLALFDTITVPIDAKIQSTYEINKIDRTNNQSYIISTSLATKTKQFLLPCLSIDGTTKDYFLYDTLLENVYIGARNIKLDNPVNTLLLLYRYSESELYRQFESRIIKHPMFIKKIDINYYQVMFLFDLSSKFTEDVRKFKYGKYSELSDKLKKLILKFYGYSQEGNMYAILYKTDKRRKQLELEFAETLPKTIELFDKPNMEIEIYQK